MLEKILNPIRKVISVFVFIFFAVVVVVVFAQVIARYVFSSSIRWADELSRFAFVWLVYIGGSITIRDGRNVCFDLILEGTKGNVHKIMFTVVSIISALFLVLVTYLGILLCMAMVQESSPILQLPMHIVCAAIPLGGFMMFIEEISYYLAHVNDTKEEEVD